MARIEKRALTDGSTRYKAIIRRKGYPFKTKTFRTRAQAAAWAKRVEVMILDHRALPTWEADRRTVADLVDRYIDTMLYREEKDKEGEVVRVVPLKKSAKDWTRCLRWWKAEIGDRKLIEVTPPLLVEYRDRLATGTTRREKKRAPATVNRYLAYLSHAFTVATKEWGWVESNPLNKVSRLKEPKGRKRFLSGEERQRLLEACEESPDPRLYPLVVLALSTGARQGELLGLRWGDVYLDRGVAVAHDTKNDETRALPITGLAADLLRRLSKVRRIDTDLVFANESGKAHFPKIPWLKALTASQIDDFRFHDLRHSAASYLAMNGATLAEIAEVLGHKTLAMVKRYSHLTEAHTAGVVARMNEAIFPNGSAG